MDSADDILLFSENFGKGIGNSMRFKMLNFLARGPRTVGEIADHLTHLAINGFPTSFSAQERSVNYEGKAWALRLLLAGR